MRLYLYSHGGVVVGFAEEGTHLSAAGVRPRTAMAAMRHSRIELAANFYTDPVLQDVAKAVEPLPDFAKQGLVLERLPQNASETRSVRASWRVLMDECGTAQHLSGCWVF